MYMCFYTFCLCLLGLSICAQSNASVCTSRPILGILTEPTLGNLVQFGRSKLQAGFVKWVESSGARVVPIMYNESQDILLHLFNSVNGLVFMGGATELITSSTPYYQSAQFLFNLTVEANRKGDYIPLWGTCLGFELLAIIASHSNFSLMGNTYYNSTNVSLPLVFTPTPQLFTSKLFSRTPERILKILATENVTDNEHHNAVTPREFTENVFLQEFFTILSTSNDCVGHEFVSTMEANKFPIYAVQWHPERAMFEWFPLQNTNHSLQAIQVSQYMGNFLVSEARQNCHHFKSKQEEQENLIYNFSPLYTESVTHGGYEQIYFF